jgi:hypothetical protein
MLQTTKALNHFVLQTCEGFYTLANPEACRLENRRYGRLENLRYEKDLRCAQKTETVRFVLDMSLLRVYHGQRSLNLIMLLAENKLH